MHYPAEQWHLLSVLKVDKRLFKEGESDPEASTGTHDIKCFEFPVYKFDTVSRESLDGRAREDTTVPDEVEKVRIERRVMTQRRMGVHGQAVFAIWPLNNIQQFGHRELFDFPRQPVGARGKDIRWHAKEEFRDKPLRAAHRKTHLVCKARGFHRDVTG